MDKKLFRELTHIIEGFNGQTSEHQIEKELIALCKPNNYEIQVRMFKTTMISSVKTRYFVISFNTSQEAINFCFDTGLVHHGLYGALLPVSEPPTKSPG